MIRKTILASLTLATLQVLPVSAGEKLNQINENVELKAVEMEVKSNIVLSYQDKTSLFISMVAGEVLKEKGTLTVEQMIEIGMSEYEITDANKLRDLRIAIEAGLGNESIADGGAGLSPPF